MPLSGAARTDAGWCRRSLVGWSTFLVCLIFLPSQAERSHGWSARTRTCRGCRRKERGTETEKLGGGGRGGVEEWGEKMREERAENSMLVFVFYGDLMHAKYG